MLSNLLTRSCQNGILGGSLLFYRGAPAESGKMGGLVSRRGEMGRPEKIPRGSSTNGLTVRAAHRIMKEPGNAARQFPKGRTHGLGLFPLRRFTGVSQESLRLRHHAGGEESIVHVPRLWRVECAYKPVLHLPGLRLVEVWVGWTPDRSLRTFLSERAWPRPRAMVRTAGSGSSRPMWPAMA